MSGPKPGCQEDVFLRGAGDAYFERNYSEEREAERLSRDRIVSLHADLHLAPPRRMLEIGCMTGFRCELFRRTFGSKAYGVEPSEKAVALGRRRYPEVDLSVGVLTGLPLAGQTFDCIVLGNFLYWLDRDSLFQAARVIDAALADKGILYVIDFDPTVAHKNAYVHSPGCFTYKMHHYKMFTWHPHYRVIHQTYYLDEDYSFALPPDDCTQITVLRKDKEAAFALLDAGGPRTESA